MLKLVGAVLIIFASAGLGYLKSRELMLHEKNLEEFLQVILCLKGEIRCGNSSLSDALRDTACRCRGRYEEFLERVAACIEANTEEKLSIIFQNCTDRTLLLVLQLLHIPFLRRFFLLLPMRLCLDVYVLHCSS